MKARDTVAAGLGVAWSALVERALAPAGEEEVLLEALALASAVGLVPSLADTVSSAARRRLVARGAALLLSSSPEGDGSDAALTRSRALTLAREGLEALRSFSRTPAEPPSPSAPDAEARPNVAPAMLRRLLSGKLDGFAAAEVAKQVRKSTSAQVELRLLAAQPAMGGGEAAPVAPKVARARRDVAESAADDAESPKLRLVADDAPALRDPAEGKSVGSSRSGAVDLEAVRFADGVVAIYAAPARRISVPVLPPGVKVVRTAMGYVELDVKKSRAKEVDVAVGSHRVSVSIR